MESGRWNARPSIVMAIRILIAVVLPVSAVFLALVLGRVLPWGPAILAGGALTAVFSWSYYAMASDADSLIAHFRQVLGGKPGARMPRVRSRLFGEMADLIGQVEEKELGEVREKSGLASLRGAILDSLPDPLIMVDRHRIVRQANQAAIAQFGNIGLGQDLAMGVRHPAVLAALDNVLSGRTQGSEVDVHLPGAVDRDFHARALSLADPANGETAIMLVFHDMTAANRAERMRVDFVANVSHELRTPLSTLTGFIETLRGSAKDDSDARQRFLAIMDEQAGRMARLINDLLSLSRIEIDEHTLPTGRVAIGSLVAAVAEALQQKAGDRRVTIAIAPHDELPEVVGDRDQLYQVFENLLNNAIKYGRPDGSVTVSFIRPEDSQGRKGRLGVCVRDQGEGIPRDHIPRLTERFYRVDSARSRALGGTGLGLAIVKHIVNRHRGQLVIESAVGEGSAFTTFLPVASASGAPARGRAVT